METTAIIAIITGATQILQVALPAIESAFRSGQVTPEEQTKLQARLAELRTAAAFAGPEWETDPKKD